MRFLKVVLLLLLLGTLGSPMLAQANTTLVVALPDWWEGQFDAALFDDFEAQHIGVDIVLKFVSSDNMYVTPPQFDIEDHISKSLDYATKGDVLYTGSTQLSVEATRAGAYLDLSPLTATDTQLDSNDFFPAFWQSFQWDGGLWAVPLSGSFIMNIYNKNALDEANIPYPDSNWTIADYATYARELTTYKASGQVDTPGFNSYYVQPLLYSLLNHGIYDMSTFPETADLTGDDISELLTQWSALLEEKVANPFGEIDFDDQDVALHVEQTWRVTNRYMDTNADWQASLLSNNRAGLQVDGFAVSSGTDYPELAYELVMYMSQSIDMMNFNFFDMPARQSMVGLENEDSAIVFGEKPPELEALIDEAVMNAIPPSELRYYGYLDYAINSKVIGEGLSIDDALLETQQLLDENLARATEIGAETTVFVESPAATPALAEGEIALNFALNTLFSPVPNREDWERVAQEFADSDLEVGLINFSFGFNGIQQVAEENDCFYRQLNDLRNAPLDQLLAIEPFLNADANFNRDDLLTGVLEQVSRDNQIWGMPMNVTPTILWVNTRLFEEAGVPVPNAQWTINEFVDALTQLATLTEDPPFAPRNFGGDYMLTLTTAFGGLLFDPSNPDSVPNLTSDQNRNAIRQALDLAKNELIEYEQLATFGGGGGGFNTDDTPIYDAMLSAIDFRFQQRRDNVIDTFQATLFPSGTQYAPITLEIGSAYISANTPYADACYRWLSYLAENPDLFDGMPARRSNFESVHTQGEDIYELYTSIDTMLNDPNTIVFPFNTANQSTFFYQQWIFRAFDAYVLEDVDLDGALEQSQQLIDDYVSCIEPTRNIDATSLVTLDEQAAYYDQLNNCATQLDPIFADLFGG